MGMHTPAASQLSPAGLTRGSIMLREKLFAKKMDCRVKPGNDGEGSRFKSIYMSSITS
jgi:hypothetical protein